MEEEVKQVCDDCGKERTQQTPSIERRREKLISDLFYLPFFSADDMNMTAMSKRPTLARLRSTSSATAGPSLLLKDGCFNGRPKKKQQLRVLLKKNKKKKTSLQIEISQSPQDLMQHVWFQPAVENSPIVFRLDLLHDINAHY